ncbi:signal peptidase I [Chitinophaga arvensicola]|nr:signal peptidase I [Chitinophaga arvensicola]
MKSRSRRILQKTGYVLLAIVLILFTLRFFFIDIYRIPSESMMNKFMTDDYILINKTFYSGYFSRFSTASPQQGDIFVFTINKDIPGFFVKRCVGLPGAVVAVKNGAVSINGQAVKEPLSVRHYYKIWYNDYQQVKAAIDRTGMDKLQNGYRRFSQYVFLALDNQQLAQVKSSVDSISLWNRKTDPDSSSIHPPELSVNILDMPALKVPFKGMKISLDQQYAGIYGNTIRMYEDSSFHVEGKDIFIAGKQVEGYTFQKDYFFMMGDNRDIAIDSRHYGLIPKDHLVGKFIQQF